MPEGLIVDVGVADTVIVNEFEVAVAGLAHALLLVRIQVTISLFCNAVVEKVALFVPALFPFILH